jgi:DNA-binding response OmpR family regulator
VSGAPPRRVLVVEDELAIRELLRLHLELAGFVLEETGDGRPPHAVRRHRGSRRPPRRSPPW